MMSITSTLSTGLAVCQLVSRSAGQLSYTVPVNLAPYAKRDLDTEGRRHPESSHPYRTDYQRDRDRIIHTKAFRRLEQKTQVFDPGHCDHFRNRLTHTLEVSQIARTVGGALRLNTDLCEVLALSHDIGHPPFSHEGEKALGRIMSGFGSGFEHNLHALRIVEYFEEKYPAFPGLNLTFEVREGIIKHSRDYTSDCRPYLDISAYRLGEKPPLEAQLIDVVDEIAYNSADLDDGYDSGLLSLDDLIGNVALFRELYEKVELEYPTAPEKLKVDETVRRIINCLATDLIRTTQARLEEHRISTVEQVRACEERLPALSPEIGVKNAELKAFLQVHLYEHAELRQAREQVQSVIEELFRHYLQHPARLPESHYERIGDQAAHQVVCDYIAGMTDSFARTSFNRELGG